ncbi:PAAR domain-containing protein, partial [Burkholderia ubonensis]|uniref:PAAR domain-containing protein n=1 Tax=Burkholderia ubonensis TaxID=101571 RepID=UPI0012FB2822
MKTEQGREMARLGDTTDHVGNVIEAADDLEHHGIGVALDGHAVRCPKCGGVFPVIATWRMHRGRRVACIGDKTACSVTLVHAWCISYSDWRFHVGTDSSPHIDRVGFRAADLGRPAGAVRAAPRRHRQAR